MVGDCPAGQRPAAPKLLPFEIAHVLRRLEGAGSASGRWPALAHHDPLPLDFAPWPYLGLAGAAWPQRGSLSVYDRQDA